MTMTLTLTLTLVSIGKQLDATVTNGTVSGLGKVLL
jgi:hypothetical protein